MHVTVGLYAQLPIRGGNKQFIKALVRFTNLRRTAHSISRFRSLFLDIHFTI